MSVSIRVDSEFWAQLKEMRARLDGLGMPVSEKFITREMAGMLDKAELERRLVQRTSEMASRRRGHPGRPRRMVGRHGSLFDIFFLLGTFLILVIGAGAAYKAVDSVMTDANVVTQLNTSNTSAKIFRTWNEELAPTGVDNMVAIIFILGHLGFLILSIFLRTHPALLIFGILFFAFAVTLMAVIVNNVLAPFMDDLGINAGFPKTRFIVDNILLLEAGFAFAGILVLYATIPREA